MRTMLGIPLLVISLCWHSGCNPTDPAGISEAGTKLDERTRDIVGQMDKMAEAIDEFTSQFPKESEKWRNHLEKLESKMKLDGEDLLANSLRTYTDLTIGTAGTQMLFLVDVLEAKIKLTLNELRLAIISERDRIKETGKFEGTIDGILKRLAKTLVLPDPMIGQISPNALNVKYVNAHGEPVVFGVAEPQVITINGYGFLRPPRESRSFKLKVTRENGESRFLTAADLITINTTTAYQVTVNLQTLIKHLNLDGSDRKIEFVWGDSVPSLSDPRYAISIVYGPQPQPVPVPEPVRVMEVIANVETTHDDKDIEIYFGFHVQRRGSGPSDAKLICRDPDERTTWPDSAGHKVDVVIPISPFAYQDRLNYEITMDYGNWDGGNQGWEGRINSVKAILSNGETKILRGDTGNFKLGEDGNPHSATFPFTE